MVVLRCSQNTATTVICREDGVDGDSYGSGQCGDVGGGSDGGGDGYRKVLSFSG